MHQRATNTVLHFALKYSPCSLQTQFSFVFVCFLVSRYERKFFLSRAEHCIRFGPVSLRAMRRYVLLCGGRNLLGFFFFYELGAFRDYCRRLSALLLAGVTKRKRFNKGTFPLTSYVTIPRAQKDKPAASTSTIIPQ